MINSHSTIVTELRISPKWIVAVSMMSGLILALLSDIWSDPSNQLQVRLFAILLYTLSAVVWRLDSWRPQVGRWFTLIALVALIYIGFNWSERPEILVLMMIPTALAATLISFPAAMVTAVGETIVLMLLPKYGADLHLALVVITLVGIWGMVGLMFAVYRSIYQFVTPLWEQFWQARQALEEARDRKSELEQALDDLAHANRELALLNERIVAMRLVAEEAQKTKSAFVAKVSHEFRTPLNMIIGLTDLLVAKPEVYGDQLPPALLEDLKIVQRNCEHLSQMVNDVLDLSQTEMGQFTLRREWVNLTECVDSAVVVVRPLLEKKNLNLRIVIPDNLPDVYCDQTRIRQVILNLVSNAIRFTEEGRITIQAEQQGRFVVASVADTGPGISPKDVEVIFEPFCQGTGHLWRDHEGSGLGLSISKQFLELHDGELWLESELGLGTTFFFKLPISPSTPPAATPGRWVNEDWVWQEHPVRPQVPNLPYKQRIIICDESGDLCPTLTHYSDEIEFVDTRNLAQATQELQEKTAHAVIFNADSPGNLWPLVKQARVEIPDTPLIACSFPPRINRALEAGAIDYLIKPVTRGDLHQAIQAVGQPVKKVLIVDDDPDVQQLLTRMLTTDDDTVKITVASSGRQALDELRCRAPDLMLIDIVMSDIDGWQTLELKNQDRAIKDIPVIVISAQDPANQPVTSEALLATFGQGLSVGKFLRGSLELSVLMLQPE